MVRNFKLSKHKLLSKACISRELTDFSSVYNHIKSLPYGRTTNRSDYASVLSEHKGTCSTKHAFLKAIAIENDVEDLKLFLGIFKMNALNTPKLKSILESYNLNYIPEAHCYLKYHHQILDLTFGTDTHPAFVATLMYETSIIPEQIGDYKVELHQSYLKSWLDNEELDMSFDELWSIREACIAEISE
ncbi:hypothetical protein [Psychroserpens sp. SPM9]|uniref:hypothetical protein n=1 Tax=Psychroserpens sp. SPM9 TaxID=2975598 RepID=UPI0021A7A29C|nr:hypothetical protein [Psychroserpens sp. SPM9]MDG5491876.1 hypothetical protein [Psychroserpens sp. SPM9]